MMRNAMYSVYEIGAFSDDPNRRAEVRMFAPPYAPSYPMQYIHCYKSGALVFMLARSDHLHQHD